ncbi:hypothetical protein B0H19DRAFT_1075621 [Mycena capillaripes]|nr:hypothetical protein B0H19DRAFT_1075621 [Mycena capillaripes]
MATASPEPEEETKHSAAVTSSLTYHTSVAAPVALNGAKSKAKPKTKKETKTKKIVHLFESSTDNHLELMRTILLKHGEGKYNITAKMVYSMKVQLPCTKKGEALDIDTAGEYMELVTEQILKERPSKLTIFVDMGEIQKRWNQKKSLHKGSDEEDVNGNNPGLYDLNGNKQDTDTPFRLASQPRPLSPE